ncbi:MAG: hypothetical protein ABIL86_11870, partial [candidate division WOR-3 bacterium]
NSERGLSHAWGHFSFEVKGDIFALKPDSNRTLDKVKILSIIFSKKGGKMPKCAATKKTKKKSKKK